jgi:hypothetical protein
MSEQPAALRLADYLTWYRSPHCGEASTELRRLYQLAQEQHTEIYGLRLEVRNLLEALQSLIDMDVAYQRGPKVEDAVEVAKAAIAKSTGETK